MAERESIKAFRGVKWSAVQRFSSQGISFVISIILARVLSPEDYGIIAITMVFILIFQTINESGFNVALMNKLDRDELDFSSVFILNIAIGLLLYLLLYLFAPFIADFFHQDKLVMVLRVIGLIVVINSFAIVQTTIFLINVDFKSQAKASICAVLLSGGLGIACAYSGWNVWALVVQTLFYGIVNTCLMWYWSKWRPKELKFSFVRIKGIMGFSYRLILSRLINTLFAQLYPVVIGHFFNVAQLGLYNKARQFETQSSNNIANVVMRVSIPLMCEAQKDHEKLANILNVFVKSTAFVVFPLLAGMMVLAKPLIIVVLTEKWIDCSWILQALCPVGMFYIVSAFNINIFNATGRTDWALQSELIKKIVSVVIVCISIMLGFTFLVWSQVMIGVFEMVVAMYYTKKQIKLGMWKQIYFLRHVIFASGIMALCVCMVAGCVDENIFKLLVGVGVGCVVYMTYWMVFEKSFIFKIVGNIRQKK